MKTVYRFCATQTAYTHCVFTHSYMEREVLLIYERQTVFQAS